MTLLSEILGRRMHLTRPETVDVVCERDLGAKMDDGAVLLADRWVAGESAGRSQPTVLVRSPYGRRQFVGLLLGRMLAERGLQVVIQSVRGTFGSEGEFRPFEERADGLATLSWLRDQTWHSGPIGTIGPSYLGFVQWALAGEAREDLAAMSIHVSASQFHGQTYAGDSLALETVASWMVIVAAQESRLGPLTIGRGLRGLGEAMSALPIGDLDARATGAEVGWYREGFQNIGRDEYWSPRDFSATVPDVLAPVQFVGGWYDILLPWMLDDFEALQAAGRSPQLLIGPWTHTAPELTAASLREGIGWMRSHLLGDDRLVRKGAPVRVLVTGERSGGGWRDLSAWPPLEVGERRLFAHEDGRLKDVAPTRAAAAGAGDHYRYDPADPTPSLGGPVLLAREAVVDNAALEERADVLVYSSEPLAQTLESIGHVAVEIWARADSQYFDIFARVCDVDLEGVSRNVCDALTSVSASRYEQRDDGSWKVTFRLWPIGHRFAAGHRIRLQVSSGAHPRYARNPGTDEHPATATAHSMRAVEIELLRDADHPSVLVLPAMP